MNAREVIADELRRLGSFLPDEETDNLLFRLSIRGFTIMAKEDVEAVRYKALEEAAKWLDDWSAQTMAQDVSPDYAAAAIRSLKSGGLDVD